MRHRGISKTDIAASMIIAAAPLAAMSSCISERQALTDPLPGGGTCSIPVSSKAVGTVVVFIKNFTFIPQQVTVKRGTTVTWINCENVGLDSHSSTSNAGVWDSSLIPPGSIYSRTFNEPVGTVLAYHCVPHPFMTGSVDVE